MRPSGPGALGGAQPARISHRIPDFLDRANFQETRQSTLNKFGGHGSELRVLLSCGAVQSASGSAPTPRSVQCYGCTQGSVTSYIAFRKVYSSCHGPRSCIPYFHACGFFFGRQRNGFCSQQRPGSAQLAGGYSDHIVHGITERHVGLARPGTAQFNKGQSNTRRTLIQIGQREHQLLLLLGLELLRPVQHGAEIVVV